MAHRVRGLWLALVGCTPVYHPPSASDAVDPEPLDPATATAAVPDLPDDLPPFRLDIPYPDLPAHGCDGRTLADTCASGCGDVPDLLAEVCGSSALETPARYHRLLLDCACSDIDPIAVDLDGDGLDDIVSACPSLWGDTVTTWYGSPERGLPCPERHTVGPRPSGVAAADFDGDGRRDLVVLHSDGAMLSLLRGLGDRSFAPHELIVLSEPPAEPQWLRPDGRLVADDLDGDGRLDLIALRADAVLAVRGDGLGGFTLGQVLAIPNECRWYSQLYDLDGDARTDLLLHCGDLVRHRNDGLGGFLPDPEAVFAAEGYIGAFTVADLTGDQVSDLLFMHEDGLGLAVAEPGGQFAGFDLVGPVLCADRLVVADLDAEPGLELVVHCNDPNQPFSRTSLLSGDPQQGWLVTGALALRGRPWLAALGDINGDGRPDLVFGHARSADSNGGMFVLESAP